MKQSDIDDRNRAARETLTRRRRGVSFVELMAAVLILSIVAAGGAATWSLSSRVPANMRVTEMGSRIAVREIERVKAQKYTNAAAGTTTTYYDKYGFPTTVAANELYLATTVIGMPAGMTATGTTKDLLQVQVTVTNTAGTKYETQRTLLAFGGI